MESSSPAEQQAVAPAPTEDATRCMIAHLDNLNELAAACDYGWLGISDETVAALSPPSDGPRRNVVVIVSIPDRKAVSCYGIFLGSVTKRADLKDHQRRELPAGWTNVARIGWVRVGEATWDSVSNAAPTGDLHTIFTQAAEKFTANAKNEAASTWTEIPKGGDIVCASIDSASLQVLPHDLRDLHLNPQAAAELAERNNNAQAQRLQNNQERQQGGRYGHGTPGYGHRHTYNNNNPQPYSHYPQQPPQQPQQGYYGQQQGYGYGQQQQAYPSQAPAAAPPASHQPQQQQEAPSDPAQAAALQQYYQYMATLTPEQQQVAYQHYMSQYYQQAGGAPATSQ